jgi:acyl-coenzyme A synthetase/AMP-(fatty) acid ligase
MNWIIEHLEQKGEKVAIIFNNKEYQYIQLAAQIKEYCELVKKRLPQGAIVSIISDYSFEAISLFFALIENKNIIVPITSKVKSEIEERVKTAASDHSIYIINNGLKFVIHENKNSDHSLITDLQNKNCSGLILFSSGSTGVPKAMIHNLDVLIDSYRDKKGKNLSFLIFLMFDHIGGLNTLLNCLSMGVTMVFPVNRDPDHVCSIIEKYQINILPASPTFLNLILISESYLKYSLSSLRMITYGTEPMPASLLLKLKEVFPRVKFLQTFGTSETGIAQISSMSSTSTFMKFSDLSTEYKICDGELWIRSKTQILGYLNSSMERFTEDGWFKTGDLVEESKDGYIKIIGRNSEMINVGGEKVLPSEVESVLFQMPGIKDCTVFGEYNPITGQMVVAKIFFEESLKISEAKRRVTAFCSDKLDRYKIPAKIILIDKLEFSGRFKKKRI